LYGEFAGTTDHLRAAHGVRDGDEVALGTHVHVGVDMLVRRHHRAGREEEGVAVGCGLGRFGRADIAAGAATVLDHHRVAPHLRELLADDPRRDVGRAAGRERDDESHRLVWEALRRSEELGKGKDRDEGATQSG
jgi:hypothetical protein